MKLVKMNTTEKIVAQIGEIAKELNGIVYLMHFKTPSFEMQSSEFLESYVNRRFNSARALSIFGIRSSLRSSCVALHEHIYGTESALREYKFTISKNKNKSRLETLSKIVEDAKTPRIAKAFQKCISLFPEWFIDKELFILKCKDEISTYKKIGKLLSKLSQDREKGKVKLTG